jgi:predicted transposase YbfD/YdcC
MDVFNAPSSTKEFRMQSTGSTFAPSVTIQRLAEALGAVPDPRRVASTSYTLAAMLALAVSAILANHRSVLAIAEFGARQSAEQLQALGFPNGRTPCQSTLQRLFRQLDGLALAQVLTQWITPQAVPAAETRQGVAVDGKAQRGRLRFPGAGGTVHALSAFCHTSGLVLAHEPIVATADKTEAELSVAPTLLARIDWTDRVLTGDALFCQRALCQQVRDAGGDYLFLVKANQPALHAAIDLHFHPPPALARSSVFDQRTARTIDVGHGRRPEVRQLLATTDLTAYLATDWPGIAQVFRIERTWREHGQDKRAVNYGITSLDPELEPPDVLLMLKRGHWGIENRLHWRKDVTFGEDASLIHVGQGPTVMALLRDAAVTLLHLRGVRKVAAQLRLHSQHPELAIAMVTGHG